MTRRSSRCGRSAAGGTKSVRFDTRTPTACRSPPMAAAVMARVCGSGSVNYNAWLMKSASTSWFTICHPGQAVESTTGAVAVGREGNCCPAAFACRCLIGSCHGSVSSRRSSNRTCRFPASGFLLSSSLRARQVGTTARQDKEAERLVEILVRILAVPGAHLSAASHQPSLQTPLNIPAYQLVGRENRALVEILGPTAEKPIEGGNS
jgi:hypothetical protein